MHSFVLFIDIYVVTSPLLLCSSVTPRWATGNYRCYLFSASNCLCYFVIFPSIELHCLFCAGLPEEWEARASLVLGNVHLLSCLYIYFTSFHASVCFPLLFYLFVVPDSYLTYFQFTNLWFTISLLLLLHLPLVLRSSLSSLY